jgi:hypothetical protein
MHGVIKSLERIENKIFDIKKGHPTEEGIYWVKYLDGNNLEQVGLFEFCEFKNEDALDKSIHFSSLITFNEYNNDSYAQVRLRSFLKANILEYSKVVNPFEA